MAAEMTDSDFLASSSVLDDAKGLSTMRWSRSFLPSSRSCPWRSLLCLVNCSMRSELDPRCAWTLGHEEGCVVLDTDYQAACVCVCVCVNKQRMRGSIAGAMPLVGMAH